MKPIHHDSNNSRLITMTSQDAYLNKTTEYVVFFVYDMCTCLDNVAILLFHFCYYPVQRFMYFC